MKRNGIGMNNATTNSPYALILTSVAMLLSVGCGGGGGGGTTSYAGTWQFRGVKVVDQCNSGVSATISSTMLVNQNGSEIAVQLGNVSLSGSVNDKDGFDASTTRPGDDGCTVGYSVTYRDASDGEADVGLALGVQCGNRTCAVGYGGGAVRLSDRELPQTKSLDLTDVEGALAGGTVKGGIDGGLENALEETKADLLQ